MFQQYSGFEGKPSLFNPLAFQTSRAENLAMGTSHENQTTTPMGAPYLALSQTTAPMGTPHLALSLTTPMGTPDLALSPTTTPMRTPHLALR